MNTIILKVAAGCNLGCDYCYEYNKNDDTWKLKPRLISDDILYHLILRIKEFIKPGEHKPFNIVFHGGEPLLAGFKNLSRILQNLNYELKNYNLKYFIQTNGTLLNKNFLDLFSVYNVKIGISLDGNEKQNSLRTFKNGKESFHKVIESYKYIKTYNEKLLSGILCVINPEDDPIEALEFLLSLEPPTIDLLLPFETHETLMNRSDKWNEKLSIWLLKAFQIWFNNERFHSTKIRIFEDILQSLITHSPKTDWFGARRITYLVVQTDGSFDLLDHLKVIGKDSEKIRSLQLNLKEHSIDDAIKSANRVLFENSAFVTPDKCSKCKYENSCAGGYLPHRYSYSKKFDNHSIACESIYSLFEYLNRNVIQNRLISI